MRLARGAAALAGSLALLAGGLAGAAAIANAATASPALPAAAGAGSGYWRTSGNQILDSAGDPVRIAGINWYGLETPDEIVHGLWAQDYHAIINDIRNLGYNTIRIPFSNQMVEDPIVPQNLGPTVVGFDLRNEPHTPAGDSYAQGATWGTGDASTDVRLAYQQAGDAILAVDPNALIFCEGIGENPTASGGTNSTWWGGDLAEAGQYPVTLRFQAQIAVTNTGTSAISPWTLTWTFPGDQKISSMWTASFTQSGESVTAASESYNATIASGGSLTIGFTGMYTSSDAPPASFAVNGTACRT